MAKNTQPIAKRCKALGISPAVMGYAKKTTNRNPGGNNFRKKKSEYATQLQEKQKLKFIYGVLEKQFYHYFEIAEKQQGQAGTNLITILESRLDNVVFRMGLATTRRESRQLVTHGHFSVNGKKIDIPSYRIKPGDVISLRENSRKSTKFKEIVELTNGRVVPLWLEANKEDFSAKVVRMPVKEDLDYEVEEHLIVELYSK